MIRACAASSSRRLVMWPSSGSRRSPGRARGPARSAGSRRRPRCSGSRSGRSTRRCPAPAVMSSLVPTPGSIRKAILASLARLGRGSISSCSAVVREAVVEGRPAQPVAVGHLDDRHAGGVQRRDDGAHLVLGELVALGVRAVAQRRVGHAGRRVGPRHGTRRSCPRERSSPSRLCRRSPRRPGGRGGHDVQVAGVRRQVVARALDLDEDGDHGLAARSWPTASSNCGSLSSR